MQPWTECPDLPAQLA
uniref:Uncharacterized protein n=1 Tax=Rhizophora mucronata TaxID=61149 RepID=A0A2P2R2T3_RHIMU